MLNYNKGSLQQQLDQSPNKLKIHYNQHAKNLRNVYRVLQQNTDLLQILLAAPPVKLYHAQNLLLVDNNSGCNV
jgi:hypothetical protein